MSLTPPVRKAALTTHLVFSVGWIGAALAYLALGASAATSQDVPTVRAAWTAMEITGWSVIVPLAVGTLVTGLVISFAGPWGLLRHYWVVISLGLTVFAVTITVLHMPEVSARAAIARQAAPADLNRLGGDLVHPGVGLVVLLVTMVLNVYKPRGVTRYGQRKQHELRKPFPRAVEAAGGAQHD